jgi:hypothetical protein
MVLTRARLELMKCPVTEGKFVRRGTETIGGCQYFLDLSALGRQEEWEEPKGRITGLGAMAGSEKLRYPDEYGV